MFVYTIGMSRFKINPLTKELREHLIATEDRFWGFVDKSAGEDGCWAWTRCSTQGRGVYTLKSRNWLAYRVAYFLAHKDIDDELLVCHRCDNSGCVNPKHLFQGTHADNSRDMHSKGRAVKNPRRGESHPAAKFTDEGIRELRRKFADGWSKRSLARHYGVDNKTIRCILRGDLYSHVK